MAFLNKNNAFSLQDNKVEQKVQELSEVDLVLSHFFQCCQKF